MEETFEFNMNRRPRKRRPKWPWFVLGALVLLLIAGAVTTFVVIRQNEYCVDITLNGQQEITLEYGEEFTDPGAEAVGYGTILKKDHQPLEITVEGEVDASKLGTYTIRYSAVFEETKETIERTVTVVDTEAPQIELVSDPERYTLPGHEYEEEGYTATDNYDGDITDKVERKVEEGTVIYTVKDSSGNETKITREIYYDDPIAPELVLKGESSITITAGNKWKDPGFTATDNVDGDITGSVTISGSVNNKKAGTYELTYEVSDSYGNVSTVKRKVTVKPAPQKPKPQTPQTPQTPSNPNNGSGKVIYLTFDDGPGKHTARLLDILNKYNAKATFFVCNTGYLHLLDDMVNAGHAVGMHTMTHVYEKVYASDEAYFEDLYGMQDLINQYAGIKPTLLRFPGGSSNGISSKINSGIMTRLTQAVRDKGFQYFDWNIDSGDAGGAKTADKVAANVINGISGSRSKSFVVLQHDIHGYSVDAVEQILAWGVSNGYEFRALDMDSPGCHHRVSN